MEENSISRYFGAHVPECPDVNMRAGGPLLAMWAQAQYNRVITNTCVTQLNNSSVQLHIAGRVINSAILTCSFLSLMIVYMTLLAPTPIGRHYRSANSTVLHIVTHWYQL
jgi:hypothetical protein